MKSTTFQQKLIFSAKLFVCAFVIGALGWLSFMPSSAPKAGAADVVVSVTVEQTDPEIKADAVVGDVGKNVPINGSSNGVGSVDVYLDMDGDRAFSAGDVGPLSGSVIVGPDGNFSGSVNMPDVDDDTYTLIIVGHPAAGGDDVYDAIDVNYKKEIPGAPIIDCIYNKNESCFKGAFGDTNDETIIVIDGDNLGKVGDTTVTVGDQECKIISVDENRVTCVVPPAKDGQFGPQNVRVCVNNKCDMIMGGFIYYSIYMSPGVPSTGLFRLGDNVVTVKDMILWGGLIVVLAATAMLIMIVKTPKKSLRYSARSGSNRKRTNSKKMSFNSSKKSSKKK